jgi:hypothetical protein
MKLLEHLRSQRRAPTTHRLGIGPLASAHPNKVTVHQIGPAPSRSSVSKLEDEQPRHHLGRCAIAATTGALGMSLPHGLMRSRDDFFVRQHRICM